jgi:glycerol-3-phosphate dehydrogenase
MRRNIAALTEQEYDVIIVGGGVFGACAAWDASLRGLSVALIERGDFSHATSANHFKMVHGGIRYLQHADLLRLRESSKERRALLRIAPHLVQPLPIIIPTYGCGRQGKGLLTAGCLLYDLLTCDRNRGLRDAARRIPRGRLLSRQECLALFPDLDPKGLTGAVLFYDGQMYNPPRLVLSYLWSAVQAGAQVANYLEATDFLQTGNRIYGIVGRDVLSGEQLEIRGKVVLNAAGPWAEQLLEHRLNLRLAPPSTYSRDACLVVARRFPEQYALAVQGHTKDPDALVSRQYRHLFIVPWRDVTLIGVWHVVHTGAPDAFTVTETELQGFLDEINASYPALALTLQDILLWQAGLVLFGENRAGAADLKYGKRSRLVDHAREHHVQGLITLIGVRATTSRGMAAKAIDLACKQLRRRAPKSRTAEIPIYGGQIENFAVFLHQAMRQRPPAVLPETIRSLVHNHGSEYKRVLTYLGRGLCGAETLGKTHTLKTEVLYAVREEMAQKLSDVVFRRTDLGTAGHPGEDALRACAELMATEMEWDAPRLRQELAEVRAVFPTFGSQASTAKENVNA